IDKSPPSRKVLKLYKDRSRAETSLITQLCTGHVGLNSPLYRIKVVDSPLCTKCGVPESADHYMFLCRRYVVERRDLRSSLKPRTPFTLSTLLSHPNISSTLTYFKNTKRFPLYFT
ncbi:hypothetical protein R3P38DRAFT_2587186, partial [Favolaschia claudopus]